METKGGGREYCGIDATVIRRQVVIQIFPRDTDATCQACKSGSSGASTLKLNFSRAFAQAQADGERRLKQMQQRMSSPRKSDTAAMNAEPAPPAQPMLTSPAAAEDGEGAPEGLVSAFLEDTPPHGEPQPQQETTLQPFDSYPGLDAVA